MLVLNTNCNTQQNSTYTATVHAIHNTVKPLPFLMGLWGGGGGRLGKKVMGGIKKKKKKRKNKNEIF